MKKDIVGKEELEILMNEFYNKAKADPVLGKMFAHVNWEKHLPLMYAFWENTLFYTGGYFGNPLKIHQDFHQKHPLSLEHFKRWEELFVETVNENFEGETAELAKQRGLSISMVMQVKILQL